MSDHCPACQIARELTEHRDTTAADWSARRAALNFARIIAERACPEYVPTTQEAQPATHAPHIETVRHLVDVTRRGLCGHGVAPNLCVDHRKSATTETEPTEES